MQLQIIKGDVWQSTPSACDPKMMNDLDFPLYIMQNKSSVLITSTYNIHNTLCQCNVTK